jgi:hypothetical protein
MGAYSECSWRFREVDESVVDADCTVECAKVVEATLSGASGGNPLRSSERGFLIAENRGKADLSCVVEKCFQGFSK